MKNRIIEILERHPTGLKAREIATLISNADKKAVNQILYANPSEFSVSPEYIWKLTRISATHAPAKKSPIIYSKPSRISEKTIRQVLWNYFNISYLDNKSVENKMYNLNTQDFNRFNENIKLICSEYHFPHIKKKDCSIATLCVEFALYKSDQFQKIVSKSKRIYCAVGNLSFYNWHRLIIMSESDFNSVMAAPERFKNIIHLPSRRTDQNQDWITFTASIIHQDKCWMFEHNNMRIYQLSSEFGDSVWAYDNWKRLVLLSERELEQEIQLLRTQKLEARRRVARDIENSEKYRRNQRLQQLAEREREAYSKSTYSQQILVKKCVGDCATCTRSECINK